MIAPHLPDCHEEDFANVPGHLREGLRDYLVHRQRPGRFLSSVLENNLTDAVLRADEVSLAYLRELVQFLHKSAPALAHGSPAAVEAWLLQADREAD